MKHGNFELTTNNSASSYGVPVLLYKGIAYGAADSMIGVVDEVDQDIFYCLNDTVTASEMVYSEFVNMPPTGYPKKEEQHDMVVAFLDECQHTTSPGARWYREPMEYDENGNAV